MVLNRRTCMVSVASDFLKTVLERLPPGVVVYDYREQFDCAKTVLRLSGPGLPEWCAEPAHGQPFPWGIPLIGADGVMVIAKAEPPGAKAGFTYERLVEDMAKRN